MATLPEIVVHGDDFGTWNWYDFAPDWQRDYSPPIPPGGGGGAAPPPPADDLPEVLVTAPAAPDEALAPIPGLAPGIDPYAPPTVSTPHGDSKPFNNKPMEWGKPYVEPAPPPAPPRAPVLPEIVVTGARALSSSLAGLFALVFPQPMGPRELDEAPRYLPFPQLPNPDRPQIDEPVYIPPKPANPTRVPFPVEVLPDVLIEQPRLKPFFWPLLDPFNAPTFDPGYRPFAEPFGDPRSNPAPDRIAAPFSDPFGQPQTDFDVFAAPYVRPDPIGDTRTRPQPLPDDFAAPFAPPGGPTTRPPEPERPVFFDTPLMPALPDVDFLPDPLVAQPWGTPVTTAAPGDPCKCAPCKDGKKRKKKKSKPRQVCYEGTYKERSKGLTKKRGKEIPCEAKKTSALDSVRSVARRVVPEFQLF